MTSTLSKKMKSDIHSIAARLIKGRQKKVETIRSTALKGYQNIRISTEQNLLRSCQRTGWLASAIDYGLVLALAPARYPAIEIASILPEMG
jgi:hypothetical protein